MKKSKKLKINEADKRQKIYNKLSLGEKLTLVQSRRGSSKKETYKILSKIKEEKK